ncbi:MAG TPA: hypothetical protein DF774_02110 [Rheinheimera sp.]|uniref:hypothetical protein n=1 Tax=Rheinheimera sp. TaxID=1869214 RepID=UPI000ED026ED|nr:hypothetical protein [Rheinheimera sp.]HCU64534.1 hypothetical protein [Rheinheimera sp.]
MTTLFERISIDTVDEIIAGIADAELFLEALFERDELSAPNMDKVNRLVMLSLSAVRHCHKLLNLQIKDISDDH